MKRFIGFLREKRFVVLLIMLIIIAIPSLAKEFISTLYFNDIETAIKWQANENPYTEILRVNGENEFIYFGKSNIGTIGCFSFYTKFTDNQTKFRIAKMKFIQLSNFSMQKMQTSPYGTTEQIAYGIGEQNAKECEDRTGEKAIFTTIEHKGKPYVFWYIISEDGLDELPDSQMGIPNPDALPEFNITMVLPSCFILIFILFVVFVFKKPKRRGI